MKHLLLTLTLVLFFATTFIGCNKGDGITGNGITPGSTVVGKWRHVKTDEYINGVFDQTYTPTGANSSCPNYIEFKNNGTYAAIEHNGNCSSYTTVEAGTYDYHDSRLSMTESGASTTDIYTVITLTNTDLKMEQTHTSSSTVYKIVIYLKKIN